MRLSTLILVMASLPLLAQQREKTTYVVLPVYGSEPQAAGTISVPISAGLSQVLENFRLAVKGADGNPLYATHQAIASAWFSDTGVIDQLVVNANADPTAKTGIAVETLNITLTAEQETMLEVRRLNLHGGARTTAPGSTSFTPLFASREGLFMAALITPGGLFWNLALKFAPDNLKAIIAGAQPNSEVVKAAIKALLQ